MRARQLEHRGSGAIERAFALAHERDHVRVACHRLLQVAEGTLAVLVVRHQRHHRQLRVEERDRAVLQLTGGIAFGVDVGDFF